MKTSNPHPRPTTDQVRAARMARNMTHAQAGACICATARSWQAYEAPPGPDHRSMHPGLWALWQIRNPVFAPGELLDD
jgi:hypothetical protein